MKMIHPDVESVADVVDAGVFNAVWAPRGWVLLGAPEAFATEALGEPVKKLDDLKVPQLKALVSARGLEYPASDVLKADVITLFRGTFPEQDTVPEAVEVAVAAGLPVADPVSEPDVPAPAAVSPTTVQKK